MTELHERSAPVSARDALAELPPEDPFDAFTAGIVRLPGGRAEVWTGLRDRRVGRMVIDDSLAQYEAIRT